MQFRRLRWLFVAVWLVAGQAVADPFECFQDYLNDASPKIVETIGQRTVDGIELTELKFLNRVDEATGREAIIYGVLARPAGQHGKLPAVLVCHGGGGSAVQVTPQVIGWAKRGYVSFCQDEPGICSQRDAKSTGPFFDKGVSTFSLKDDPRQAALYDGIAAGLNGLRILRSQPDVDLDRVGVTGGSWGGYMTTMVTGLAGRRVKASFAVYGCGYYDVGSAWTYQLEDRPEAERKLILDNLDAGRVAKNLSSTHFVASPANDWFFWPCAVMRTLADLPGDYNYTFMPNDSHSLSQPGGMIGPPPFDHTANRTWLEQVWLNYYLKGEGEPFPRADAAKIEGRESNSLKVSFHAAGPLKFEQVRVCYAAGELNWRLKWWTTIPAEPVGDDRYVASIPIDEPGQPVNWFGMVSDSNNRTVSTLVQTADPRNHGFKVEGYPIARFEQGFEEAPEIRPRWRERYGDRRPGTLRLTPLAARSGKRGLELTGESSFACHGLRAATLLRQGATGVRLWIRAAEGTCPMPGVDLLAEERNGRRHTWSWTKVPTAPLTEEWQQVTVLLTDLAPDTANPPVEMLSEALGQFRFNTGAETHVYIDDVVSF